MGAGAHFRKRVVHPEIGQPGYGESMWKRFAKRVDDHGNRLPSKRELITAARTAQIKEMWTQINANKKGVGTAPLPQPKKASIRADALSKQLERQRQKKAEEDERIRLALEQKKKLAAPCELTPFGDKLVQNRINAINARLEKAMEESAKSKTPNATLMILEQSELTALKDERRLLISIRDGRISKGEAQGPLERLLKTGTTQEKKEEPSESMPKGTKQRK